MDLGVCVLSEEPKPGRNETVWGTHAELFAQVQSYPGEARDQGRDGRNRDRCITVAELDWRMTEAGREDARDTLPTSLPTLRPDSQPEPEFNAPATPNATSRSTRSETHAEPETQVATSIGTDTEIESRDRRVRVREESTDPSRHTLDTSPDRESMVEPRGRMPRRAEISEHGVSCVPPSQVHPSLSRRVQLLPATLQTETPYEHDRGRTFGRLPDDIAARPPRTIDPERGKSDDHCKGKGGETKFPRRGEQGTRNLFDCIG